MYTNCPIVRNSSHDLSNGKSFVLDVSYLDGSPESEWHLITGIGLVRYLNGTVIRKVLGKRLR